LTTTYASVGGNAKTSVARKWDLLDAPS